MARTYNRDSITRAFEHHAKDGRTDFRFITSVGDKYHVELNDTPEHLTTREAWLVAHALAAGRRIEQRTQSTT